MDGSESDKPLEISFSGAGFLANYHVGALKCIQVCIIRMKDSHGMFPDSCEGGHFPRYNIAWKEGVRDCMREQIACRATPDYGVLIAVY